MHNMNVQPIKTRVFVEHENIVDFISAHAPVLKDGTVLAVTSKIVALAEGRTVLFEGTNKDELIQHESDFAIKTPWAWLTIKDGNVLPSAGVDESNAQGVYILLPTNSFESAARIRAAVCARYTISNLGVLITDSRTAPLRSGVTAVALGWAGFNGIRDYVGKKDIFGREFKYERVNVADSLATASAFVMGEGAEQQPLAIITDAPVEFTNEDVDPASARIDPNDDLYRPFFDALARG